MHAPAYKEVTYKYVKHLCTGDLILIVTATDIETDATHKKIMPLQEQEAILKVFEGDLTYYFGMFGNYMIAHVQCGSMGSISRDSSIMTVSTAIKKLKAKIVLMVGIAFGVDPNKISVMF